MNETVPFKVGDLVRITTGTLCGVPTPEILRFTALDHRGVVQEIYPIAKQMRYRSHTREWFAFWSEGEKIECPFKVGDRVRHRVRDRVGTVTGTAVFPIEKAVAVRYDDQVPQEEGVPILPELTYCSNLELLPDCPFKVGDQISLTANTLMGVPCERQDFSAEDREGVVTALLLDSKTLLYRSPNRSWWAFWSEVAKCPFRLHDLVRHPSGIEDRVEEIDFSDSTVRVGFYWAPWDRCTLVTSKKTETSAPKPTPTVTPSVFPFKIGDRVRQKTTGHEDVVTKIDLSDSSVRYGCLWAYWKDLALVPPKETESPPPPESAKPSESPKPTETVSEPPFKVGDRVRVVGDTLLGVEIGKKHGDEYPDSQREGIVSYIDHVDESLKYKTEDDYWWAFWSECQKVEDPKPEPEFKVGDSVWPKSFSKKTPFEVVWVSSDGLYATVKDSGYQTYKTANLAKTPPQTETSSTPKFKVGDWVEDTIFHSLAAYQVESVTENDFGVWYNVREYAGIAVVHCSGVPQVDILWGCPRTLSESVLKLGSVPDALREVGF
jgi:hypothetical protein